MNQNFSDKASLSSVCRGLRFGMDNLQIAFDASEHHREKYQLQVKALHEAVKALECAYGGLPGQDKFKELLALCREQGKTNQP